MNEIEEIEVSHNTTNSAARFLIKRLSAPESLTWKAQKVILHTLDQVCYSLLSK